MASSSVRQKSFFPKADAVVLAAKLGPLPVYPQIVGPVYDPENVGRPIEHWPTDAEEFLYPSKAEPHAPTPIPEPQCLSDRYLRAYLAKNERLRLSMLWYYTHNIFNEDEFLLGLQEKTALAQESIGWEFVVIGLLDVNVYIRLATIGLSLAILPRGETICAHTVTQPPGSIFLLPNMMEDWRFRECPYVERGGLMAYAGAPLRLQNESGDCVALGSLCVASSTSQDPLTKTQQSTLARLADWVVSDLIQCTRARRQRVRRRMTELIPMAQGKIDATVSEDPVFEILAAIYPDATISLSSYNSDEIKVEGIDPIPSSELEGGLWEDVDYLDSFITNSNNQDLPSNRVVRVITARCETVSGPSLLIVASKNYRHVYDDIDAWFVQTCADMLSRMWQKHLLAEVMRAKERFLRGFSHQLRTPLHVILSSAELLAEELKTQTVLEISKSTPVLRELAQAVNSGQPTVYLDTIKTAGRDLISIINNMITLNRWADIAAMERHYALHTIRELETEVSNEVLKVLASDPRYKTSVMFNHNLPQTCNGFCIDLGLLRDTLLPVIVNAIQGTPDGIVIITVSATTDAKEFVVDVADDGCGIRPDDHERIFESYEQAESLHHTGAGLGLTIASKFAALLHGSVDLVSSELGQGSHFRATFKGVEFECLTAPLLPQLADKLTHLPPNFLCWPSASNCLSLSKQFSTFLLSHGFTASDSPESCFSVVEFLPDSEQHAAQLAKIPKDQVAICLVPASEAEVPSKDTSHNVVYVTAPFFTPTMCSSIAEADQLLANLKCAHTHPSQPEIKSDETPLVLPKIEECSIEDRSPDVDEKLTSISSLLPCSNTPPVQPHVSSLIQAATLPIALEALLPSLEAVVSAAEAIPVPLTPISSSKPIALLVDDNAINLRILQMYCNKRGLEYHSAVDGLQAVDIFTQRQSLYAAGQGAAISLILMDLQMPVCDGIEATRQIRDLETEKNWPRSTLFIVTGQDGSNDRAAADAAGADDYFVKPVGIKLLDSGVKRYFPDFKAG